MFGCVCVWGVCVCVCVCLCCVCVLCVVFCVVCVVCCVCVCARERGRERVCGLVLDNKSVCDGLCDCVFCLLS